MNPNPAPKDLALVGAGYWGKNLARNFHALGALHTICDQSEATLSSFEKGYEGVEKTTNLNPVLLNETITKIAIAAPAAQHGALVRQALEAGKDVFVEKPLCLDPSEAAELVELAAKRQRVLMVGHLLQYHPCIERLKVMVAQGGLGKLQYITSNRLNLGKIRQEENALWSFAPHDLSVILSLAGNEIPDQIRCTGEGYLNHGIADTTLTSMRFDGSLRAHIYVSWLNPFKEQKLTVVGSHGMIVFDDTKPWAEKLRFYRQHLTWANGRTPTPSKAAGEPVQVEESEPLRNECAHFLDCCQDRRPPRTDGQEGLRVLKVLSMAQASLERDGEAVVSVAGGQCFSVPEASVRPATETPKHRNTDFFAHETAVIDEGATIGKGTKIWHFSHVMKGAVIGEKCVLGQNVNVDGGTKIGNNVKIQNNVSVYTGVELEDDVFLGPSCVLTNVTNPRSQVNRHSIYEKTVIRRGATIGANATIVCGVSIGRYAFVAAGAVVTKDVPDYALMIGNPARQKGWMSRHGHPLKPSNDGDNGIMTCPESGLRYKLEPATETPKHGNTDSPPTAHGLQPTAYSPPPTALRLRCLDIEENESLPEKLKIGCNNYREFKTKQR